MRKNKKLRADNMSYNYSILLRNKLVGAIGVNINQHRTYIGEIGYFVDRAYWGKGIAPRAVELIEKVCFDDLGLNRIELVTLKQNKASIRIAEKSGYRKEGIQRHLLKHEGKWADAYLFAKVGE